jgi:hypothetical protein
MKIHLPPSSQYASGRIERASASIAIRKNAPSGTAFDVIGVRNATGVLACNFEASALAENGASIRRHRIVALHGSIPLCPSA